MCRGRRERQGRLLLEDCVHEILAPLPELVEGPVAEGGTEDIRGRGLERPAAGEDPPRLPRDHLVRCKARGLRVVAGVPHDCLCADHISLVRVCPVYWCYGLSSIDRPLSRASLLGARELSRRLSDFLPFLVDALADVLIRLAILTARETSELASSRLLSRRAPFSLSPQETDPASRSPRSSRGKLSSTWRLQDAVPTKLRRGVVSYTDFSARKSFTRFKAEMDVSSISSEKTKKKERETGAVGELARNTRAEVAGSAAVGEGRRGGSGSAGC